MNPVPLNTEIEIEDPNAEIDIEIDYRCFFTPNKAFAPMTVFRSIYEGETLQQAIAKGKKRYEKDYHKVEVMAVRVDQ